MSCGGVEMGWNRSKMVGAFDGSIDLSSGRNDLLLRGPDLARRGGGGQTRARITKSTIIRGSAESTQIGRSVQPKRSYGRARSDESVFISSKKWRHQTRARMVLSANQSYDVFF